MVVQEETGFRVEALEAQLEAVSQSIKALQSQVEAAYRPSNACNKSTGSKLTVALDLRGMAGRSNVTVWVSSSGAAEFFVEASTDGKTWRLFDTISLAGAGSASATYVNSYPVVRVRTEAPNNNEIEIVATR